MNVPSRRCSPGAEAHSAVDGEFAAVLTTATPESATLRILPRVVTTNTRKTRDLTQRELAGISGAHVTQIRCYEAGSSAPTLDVLRNIAVALNVTTDSLIFGNDERGPSDDLALVFEAAGQLDDEGRQLVKALVEGIVLRQQSRRFANAS